MDKTYRPVLPATSRVLQKKWDDKYYSEHRSLVRGARPTVDTRPPKTYIHLHMNLKRIQLEEDRIATIERDNHLLLDKMSQIMLTSSGIDNHNAYERKSLNQGKRQKELLRISKENATLLKRLMERSPEPKYENGKNDNRTKAASCLARIQCDSESRQSTLSLNKTNNEKPAGKRQKNTPQDNKKNGKTHVVINEPITATENENKQTTQQ